MALAERAYVQYDAASVNGVAIESPVFYSTVGHGHKG